MRIISLLLLTVLTYTRCWAAFFYVTDNQGTLAGNDFVSVVDLTTNTVIGNIDCNGFDMTHPVDIHFNLSGTNAFVVSDAANAVFIINTAIGKVVGKVDDTLNPFDAPVIIDVALASNKAYVTNEAGGTGGQGSVSIVDLAIGLVTGKVDDTLGPVNLPVGVGFSNNGTKAYVCNLTGHNISIVDSATNAVTGYVNDVAHPFVQPLFPAWSASTKAYITDLNNGLGGFVNVVDGATNTVTGIVSVGAFPPFANPVNAVEGPDGTIYIADTVNNNIYEVNPTTNAVTHIFTGTFSFPLGISITSDNTTAYVANQGNNTISIVNLATRTQTGTVNAVAFPFHVPYQIQQTGSAPAPFTSLPLRPICIQGEQIRGSFSTQTEFYNQISWCASPTQAVVSYNIYRNGALIESVSADTLTFSDTDIQKHTVYTYGVASVDSSGKQGQMATVSVP